MGIVQLLHARVANAAWLFMVFLGAWNLINYVRGRGLDGNVLGTLVVGELLMVAQGILGLVLVVAGLMPAETLHFVYGCLIALLFPALWVYTRGETDRRASLWWGLASLALMALAFRAIGTGT